MINILESTKYVVDNSVFVKINKQNLENIAAKIKENNINSNLFVVEESFKHLNTEQILAYNVIYNAINFCFWGNPKWEIEFNGKNYGGSVGLVKCFARALENNIDILNPEYLKNMTEDQFEILTKGNVMIPLANERLKQLNVLGKLIIEKFDGKFINIFEKGEYNALKITDVLVEDLKEVFCDESMYDNKKVAFYKRAQIVSVMIDDFVQSNIAKFQITGLEKLTALADYKIPQILREFEILKYNDDLADRIDKGILIAQDSQEEVEIRANTVWSIELLKELLIKEYPNIMSVQIDKTLWLMSRKFNKESVKPYHKTITTAY